ncbi:putative sulfate/molybdate transporter [Desulfoprunum benzoelyticum]|uniref:SulP family sulfate permease n=1 Tax=Desulfoprunum benzoelyticum TaxID=1506996 RepID=A0A840UXT6_9BACT|nr:putative sulfate/molybdate transporter [Desulfoprunum benzoelyticum]MBB5346310.1 SulP family sulfate permease [Desulfoprunum benzoelyticum]MBM9528691.1 putative sulfate/molybdate transporter [Desulfoprunum benzoelyticum]
MTTNPDKQPDLQPEQSGRDHSPDQSSTETAALRFDRVELSGAFGDLGTLLPIVVAMILINNLSPSTVFLAFGLFYLLAGFYYRLPIPVQPLKAVGAIAIAYPAVITESVIGAAGIIFGVILLALSLTGMVDQLAKLFSQAVVRGIQLTLGLIFLKKGIELIIHKDLFMSGVSGRLSGLPVNMVIGIAVFCLVLLLLDNKRFPAALAALAVGIVSGIALGGLAGRPLTLGPTDMHLIHPTPADFWTAFIMLILPQIPLTIGNACVGTADTCTSLFSGNSQLRKAKAGMFAFSMGIINLPAGLFGAVPMCHGTGGLAAHFRFGARTGGAPIMIGIFFIVVALVLGEFGFTLLALIPQSVLGVLLVFAGLELCPLLRSLKTNEEYFVALLIAGIALVVPNMGWAFAIGIGADFFIRKMKIKI